MTKLRFHILALYAASLVLAAFAWCAPAMAESAAAAPHHHMHEADRSAGHAHETGAGHAAHGGAGEAVPHDCGIDATACACNAVSDGVLPAMLTARDGGMETGTPAPRPAPLETVFAPQELSPEPPPERRSRLAQNYDAIYGLTGRMLI